jgi:hypothetical protein
MFGDIFLQLTEVLLILVIHGSQVISNHIEFLRVGETLFTVVHGTDNVLD